MMSRSLRLSVHPFARRLERCRRGGTTLEFALAAPVIATLLLGVIEVAMILFVDVLLEGGVRDASRYGVTGQVPDGRTREERIVEIVAHHTMGLLDISADQVEVLTYPSFAAIGTGEAFTDSAPGNGQYDPGEAFTDGNGNGVRDGDVGVAGSGGSDDVVLYRVRADWHVLTPLFAELIGDHGRLTLQASVAVRNEPFNHP